MEAILDFILRPGPYVVAMAAYILTYFVVKIVHLIKPSWRAKKQTGGTGTELVKVRTYSSKPAMWWNEIAIQAIPVLAGMAIGSIDSEFLHGEANESFSTRVMMGAGLGWFSTMLYKGVRRALVKRTGIDIPKASMAPQVSVDDLPPPEDPGD